MPAGTPPSLVATFSYRGSQVLTNGGPQVSSVTQGSFGAPTVYTMMASDSTVKQYVLTVVTGG